MRTNPGSEVQQCLHWTEGTYTEVIWKHILILPQTLKCTFHPWETEPQDLPINSDHSVSHWSPASSMWSLKSAVVHLSVTVLKPEEERHGDWGEKQEGRDQQEENTGFIERESMFPFCCGFFSSLLPVCFSVPCERKPCSTSWPFTLSPHFFS